MDKLRLLVAISSVGILAPLAHAQQEAGQFDRTLQQIQQQTLIRANDAIPLDQRITLDYGGYVSFGYLSLQDNNGHTHGLRQTEVVPYARLNIDGAHEFFARFRTGYRDFNSGDNFTGSPQSEFVTTIRNSEPIDGEFDALYYKFDLARYEAAYQGKQIDHDVVIKAGVDTVYWGNGLVLSQILQGGMVDLVANKFSLSIIAGETPVRTVDFDTSRPAFDYNTRRGFYGALAQMDLGQHHPFVYYLYQNDDNSKDYKVIQNIPTHFDYNSWYIGIGSNGQLSDRLLYGVEAAYEGGDGQSNSFTTDGSAVPQPLSLVGLRQKHETIQAWAADARLDYLMADEHHTRLGTEFIMASGDPDRTSSNDTYGGNRVNTNDHAFNAFGLLNTGLAFAPSVSNIMALRVGGSTFPFDFGKSFKRMQLGTDLFAYAKMNRVGGIDEPTDTARFLGWEPDLYMNWQITSDVTFAARYGMFFPHADSFPANSAPGDGDMRQFLYLTVTYSF